MLRYAPLCIRLVRKCVGLMHTNDGRYWIRTSDPFRVKEVRYHCANRPLRRHLTSPSCFGSSLKLGAEEMVMIGAIKPGAGGP